MLTLFHQRLAVDYQAEIEVFLDKFPQYRYRDNKLQSCSPFRSERHPSFAVNLDNGTWIDSGAVGEFQKGNFITLLSFLREEQYEDTCEYLTSVYSPLKKDVSDLHLDMTNFGKAPEPPNLKVFTADELSAYAYRHPYLQSRGISEPVQRLFRVGFDPEHKAVAMCWCDPVGQVVNIKFRSISDKHFWYAGGQRIKSHIYGYHALPTTESQTVVIVESEIDCMRLWTLGIPAFALGTAHVSAEQGKLLLNTPVQEYVIATDNDSAGRKCGKQLEQLLAWSTKVTNFKFFNTAAKDISDLSNAEILDGYTKREILKLF